MRVKKVLFIASHRMDRAPGQRFRFEQYFSWLESHGFHCELSFLLNEEDDKVFYSHGRFFSKAAILVRNYLQRWRDVKRADQYDIIFIFREALMTRSLFFEKAFARSKAKVIFDFDDAIWKNDTSDANRLFSWMKNPAKIAKTIGWSDLVFAGNTYLANYAKQYNANTVVVPTTIDTDEYVMRTGGNTSGPIVIGWSGSLTTIKHFENALPFLRALKKEFGEAISIKVIGDANYRNEELGIQGIGWSRASELKELGEIDIGIMPLPDDEWARGKCGLKGLQYMALGIPAVMSPVGVNSEIIEHGVNGFLCRDSHEWTSVIRQLANSPEDRLRIGRAARETVVSRYSVVATRELYLKWFNSLADE